jgi:hypothetical protein
LSGAKSDPVWIVDFRFEAIQLNGKPRSTKKISFALISAVALREPERCD